MRYFSSDIHFDGSKDFWIDSRPFKDMKTFEKYIIKTWNKQSKKDDTIYIVGDFVDCDGPDNFSWQHTLNLVKKFKASIVLITGNNEDRVIKYFFDNDYKRFKEYCLQCGFSDVMKYCKLTIHDQEFYLVHKPKQCKKEFINLFGHTHRAGGLYRSYGFNVGCDLNFYRLYSEYDILKMLELKTRFWDHDENLKLI